MSEDKNAICSKCGSNVTLQTTKINKMWSNYWWCDKCEVRVNPIFKQDITGWEDAILETISKYYKGE